MFKVGQKVKIVFSRSGLSSSILENLEITQIDLEKNRMLLKDKALDMPIKDIEFTANGELVEYDLNWEGKKIDPNNPETLIHPDDDMLTKSSTANKVYSVSRRFKVTSCFNAKVVDHKTVVKGKILNTVKQETAERYSFKLNQKVKVYLDRPEKNEGVCFENFYVDDVNLNSKNITLRYDKKKFLHIMFWLDGRSKKNQDSTPIGFIVDDSVELKDVKVLKNIFNEIKDQYLDYISHRQKLATERKEARDKKAAEKTKISESSNS